MATMAGRDRLQAMLPHWIEHNAEHAADFRVWAGPAGEAEADIDQMEAANKALMAALTKLGGSLGNHDHHHQHDS